MFHWARSCNNSMNNVFWTLRLMPCRNRCVKTAPVSLFQGWRLMLGKIAFPIPGESPLGGVLTIEIEGDGLEDWLQAATWHEGRSQVPRAINDDLAMADDGEASTWV